MKHTRGKKQQTGHKVLETILKIKKMAAELAEKFVLAFKDVSWKIFSRCLPLMGSGQIQGKTKKNFFFSHALV